MLPLCTKCPFKKNCKALAENKIAELPVKNKGIKMKNRWFYYLIVHYRDKVLVSQRQEKDIWQGLFEFPLIETESSQAPDKIVALAKKKKWFGDAAIELQTISALFKENFQWVDNKKLNQLAFPQFINQFLNERVKQSSLF
jgi:A/G-specific adenine glycosylase